jgi:predicted SprT family Zn-dependent metalloprotease
MTRGEFVNGVLVDAALAWSLPDLPQRLSVSFSARMTRNFGVCRYDGRLTLARRLLDGPPEALREVLVHEAAHYAAFLRHGRRVRPHGHEWAALMRQAGLHPRARLPALPGDPPAPRYLHRCPRCAASRVARRAVRAWRCVRCLNSGRDGVLEIVRLL